MVDSPGAISQPQRLFSRGLVFHPQRLYKTGAGSSVPRGKEEVSGVVHWTKRVRSTFTDVPTSRLRQERIGFINALLLQKETLFFILSCEHMFISSNCLLVAHPSATSEGTLSPSSRGFFRTDVLSSHYSGEPMPRIGNDEHARSGQRCGREKGDSMKQVIFIASLFGVAV
jgi:hypothetical protein